MSDKVVLLTVEIEIVVPEDTVIEHITITQPDFEIVSLSQGYVEHRILSHETIKTEEMKDEDY